MLRGRSWVGRAGVVLVLLVTLGAATIALPHADGRDAACAPVAVAHDESAHHIRADPTQSPRDGEHCFLCHSLRSFHPAFDTFEQHHHGPRAERLHIASIDRALRVGWSLVPGRAPPA